MRAKLSQSSRKLAVISWAVGCDKAQKEKRYTRMF